MKYNATDSTILILFRADSIVRLENVIAVTRHLCDHFNINIYLLEADSYCNGILQKVLNQNIQYEFVEDNDPILHKTWYFNQMLKKVDSPYIAIWDADVIAECAATYQCLNKLRNGDADIALPYNGVCMETSKILRAFYLKEQDEMTLVRHINKMDRMSEHTLVGGAVLMNRQRFIDIGGENESYYGWGDDDFDRYIRFMNHGLKIFRSKNTLFHLTHPRGTNSGFNCELHRMISKGELHKTQNLYE